MLISPFPLNSNIYSEQHSEWPSCYYTYLEYKCLIKNFHSLHIIGITPDLRQALNGQFKGKTFFVFNYLLFKSERIGSTWLIKCRIIHGIKESKEGEERRTGLACGGSRGQRVV